MDKELTLNHLETIWKKGEPNWENVRGKGLGGSDAGTVMGDNQYSSLFELYWGKKGIRAPFNSTYTDYGHKTEGKIREEFPLILKLQQNVDVKVWESPYTYRNKNHNYMIANLDGLVEIDGEMGILEIKTANIRMKDKWANNQVPKSYYWQVMHYMAVTGLSFALVVAEIGCDAETDTRGVIEFRLVRRDEEAIARLMEAEKNFWYNNLLADVEPEMKGSEKEHKLIQLINEKKENKGSVRKYCEDTELRYMELLEKKEEMKALEAEIKRIEGELKQELGYETEVLIEGGSKILRNSKTEYMKFSTEIFEKDHPELYAEYKLNQVSFDVLRTKKAS